MVENFSILLLQDPLFANKNLYHHNAVTLLTSVFPLSLYTPSAGSFFASTETEERTRNPFQLNDFVPFLRRKRPASVFQCGETQTYELFNVQK